MHIVKVIAGNHFSDRLLIGLLPIAVILISAVIYYFGVRWGDTHVDESNAASNYFAGVLFVINYMLEPYLIILFVKWIIEKYTSYSSISEKNTSWVICFLLILEFILLLLFQCGAYCLRGKRKSLDNFIECKKLKPLNLLINIKRKSLDNFIECKKLKPLNLLINIINWLINILIKFTLSRFFPLMIIFIMYGLYKLNESFEIILLSFILAFLTFTNFAFCAGYYCILIIKMLIYI